MGEWVIGAVINLFGSLAINFGTNLLKLGHNEREKHSMLENNGSIGKTPMKPIIYFQTWRVGITFFIIGNCLNFISFGYAAQSLLAALGSVQFVSNIAFAYFVLHKMVTVKVMVATAFIVLGNVFLVAFGNHQSPVYTPEQLVEKYGNITFLLYCVILILVVALHHSIYRRGELLLSVSGQDLRPYWHMLLPFSYAIVSGAIGSCSVLFAKSLSILLRLAMSSDYQLHSWFTYSLLLLFLSTAGFWIRFRLRFGKITNRGDGEFKDNSSLVSGTSTSFTSEEERLIVSSKELETRDAKSFSQGVLLKITDVVAKAKIGNPRGVSLSAAFSIRIS
uniref:Probable magnesium transporter n=1 Tax=Cucumis sativus TaxID=3659 RepID=A0A0A0L9M2_CUCSA